MAILRVLREIIRSPLNRDRPLSALLRFARWQISSRIAPGSLIVPWIGDVKFIAGSGETGLTGNYYRGLHEFRDMSFLLHALRPSDCFLDVGANVGSYTLLACGVAGARGYAFEPVPATYERLCANLRLNDLVGRVTPLNQGVGETAGTLRFSSGLNAMNHVLGPGESDPRGVDVTVTTLDAAIGESATLMKMDVEGFETPALAGAARTLADPSLHSIIIELNGSGARYGYDDQKIAEKLQSLGFALYDYDPFTRRLAPSSDYSFQHGNALFIRDFERAQQLVQTAPKFRVLDRDV